MNENRALTQRSFGGVRIELWRGDITAHEVDAIVNAANSTLLGGGGVDGAIHRRGGPEILAACESLPPDARGRRCATGDARITTAGNLPCRYVIHAVGPVWRDGLSGEAEKLRSAYQRSLRLAGEHADIKSLAFPSISTGAYRFPIGDAAPIALETAIAAAPGAQVEEVRFVLFSAADFAVYDQVLQELSGD